jgi:RNA polymerase sigma-70 factor (ECF subfamily)
MQEPEIRTAYPKAYRFAYNLANNADDAADLVQASLLKCLQWEEARGKIRDLLPYLRKTIYHEWVTLRRRAAIVSYVSIDGMQEAAGGATPAILGRRSAAIDDFAYRQTLAACIAGLPVDYRLPLLLVCVQDKSYEEAAAILGVAIGTVKSRIFRARKQLVARLEGERDALA